MLSLNPNFSSIGQANHMILAVPLKDTILFLECTSQDFLMGYIGQGNANKTVLLVKSAGGELVQTPTYS